MHQVTEIRPRNPIAPVIYIHQADHLHFVHVTWPCLLHIHIYRPKSSHPINMGKEITSYYGRLYLSHSMSLDSIRLSAPPQTLGPQADRLTAVWPSPAQPRGAGVTHVLKDHQITCSSCYTTPNPTPPPPPPESSWLLHPPAPIPNTRPQVTGPPLILISLHWSHGESPNFSSIDLLSQSHNHIISNP